MNFGSGQKFQRDLFYILERSKSCKVTYFCFKLNLYLFQYMISYRYVSVLLTKCCLDNNLLYKIGRDVL
jgi:hypothetical protein